MARLDVDTRIIHYKDGQRQTISHIEYKLLTARMEQFDNLEFFTISTPDKEPFLTIHVTEILYIE